MDTRIGLFGGTFNPIHVGHLIVARAAAEQLHLTKMIFVPSARPPHKPAEALPEPQQRLQMVRLAIAGQELFEASDCELRRGGPSYTIETVAHFRQRFGPQAELFWLIGADSLTELASWHRIEALVEACQIATARRSGWDAPDLSPLRRRLSNKQIQRLEAAILSTPRIDISASQIRQRIRQGLSIRWLVPEPVEQYIVQHRLYRQAEPTAP
ncbi:MAG: nicotinate-nucleotide adenylyltransferase [Phycisphaerae bacterium]